MDAATNSTEAILAASDAIVAAFDRFTNATRVLIWHLQPQDSLWSRVYGPCIGAVLGVTLGHLLVFFFTVYKMRDSEVDNNDGSKTMDNDKGLQRVASKKLTMAM
ncbi:hypothetical protein SCUCBS95973_000535 [Sporothrix curviconia]|uniref:Transmembrane protein n=1 Tax=Sporothrix curviconia TaxID=1260050 RepID=A0ABP0AR64_9PEZI